MIQFLRDRTGKGELIASLQKQFQLGASFTRSYVQYFQTAQDVVLRHPRDLKSLTDTQQMWFSYALSTNRRGADLANAMRQVKPFSGRRYLDIGCGFGGSLVAAAAHGAHPTGIEVDEQRIAFARLNISDYGLASTVQVVRQDVLDPHISDTLGTFDLISCNDVAEHVEDVEPLFRNVSHLLASGGLLYIEIPNRYYVDFVARDGHFGLFGITLLDRPQAQQYHWQLFHYTYDVGHYLALEEYLALFSRFALRAQLIPSLYHATHGLSDLPGLLRDLERARADFAKNAAVSPDTRALVLDAYHRYCTDLARDRALLTTQDRMEEHFRNTYLRAFWTFIAFKDQV